MKLAEKILNLLSETKITDKMVKSKALSSAENVFDDFHDGLRKEDGFDQLTSDQEKLFFNTFYKEVAKIAKSEIKK